MRCFKLLGERVMASDFDRQVAELQIRATILNRFTRLGTPTTVAVTMP
jgi:chromosome condensin MukBEF MukE localization factor